MIFIRHGFLEKCMADKGFGIYVFSLGKEIHYAVLCAVFWGFRTIRARDFQDYWKMKSYLSRIREAQWSGFEIEAFCRHLQTKTHQ